VVLERPSPLNSLKFDRSRRPREDRILADAHVRLPAADGNLPTAYDALDQVVHNRNGAGTRRRVWTGDPITETGDHYGTRVEGKSTERWTQGVAVGVVKASGANHHALPVSFSRFSIERRTVRRVLHRLRDDEGSM